MNEERRMILQMIQEGTITIDEAEQLLNAVPKEGEIQDPATYPVLSPRRIVVTVREKEKTKVNVKIPFSLVRIGLKLGQTFSAWGLKDDGNEQARQAVETLRSIDIDELLASISDGIIELPYTLVEVEDDEQESYVKVVLE